MNANSTTMTALSEATLANLVDVTTDPVDALRLASDLYAMNAYVIERAARLDAGAPFPQPPTPLSSYMHRFLSIVKAKLLAIAVMFDHNEHRRLKRIGHGVVARIDRHEPGLADEIFTLVCMAPEDAVAWIRDHLDELEARFAS